MSKVPITDAERCSPYYKYYATDMAAPAPELLTRLEENPLTAETALKITDVNDLFLPGYLPGEYGYCRLEDGSLTVSNLMFMSGVTPEMFDWWFAWHSLEPMRYKIWDPEDHYYGLTRNPDRMRDNSISLKERCYNTISDVEETMGAGPVMKAVIQFRNPADIGFDPEKLAAFGGTIVCSGGEHAPVVMCHFLRPMEGGCELRSHFWIGWCIRDGRPFRLADHPINKMPVETLRNQMHHNIVEFSNLAAILPSVYEEFKDQW